MSELTLFLIKISYLAILWIFVLQLYLSTGTGLPRPAKRAAPAKDEPAERPAGESEPAPPPVKTTIL